MSFEEMCEFAYNIIKECDGGGIDSVYDLPDYYVFTSAEKGYGSPQLAIPKDGGTPFCLTSVMMLDEPNILRRSTPKIPFPKRFAVERCAGFGGTVNDPEKEHLDVSD